MTLGIKAPTAFLTKFNSLPPVDDDPITPAPAVKLVLLGDGNKLFRKVSCGYNTNKNTTIACTQNREMQKNTNTAAEHKQLITDYNDSSVPCHGFQTDAVVSVKHCCMIYDHG